MTRRSRFKRLGNQKKEVDGSYEDNGLWEWARDEKTLPKKLLKPLSPKTQPSFGSVDAPPPS